MIGRLDVADHVGLNPAAMRTRTDLGRFEGILGVVGLDFFDIGRQWIVKSFERLTTDEMHKVWRKK